ncbi:MAG: hypothetical protein CME69_08605 [Halobacteriovorax sp.]|nr:hypothetical protein [Halobacteriovorax sp.]
MSLKKISILTLLLFVRASLAEVIPVFSPHLKTNLEFREKVKKQMQAKKKQVIFFSKYEEFNSYVSQESPKEQIRLVKNIGQKGVLDFLSVKKIKLQAYTLKERPVKDLDGKNVGVVKFTENNDFVQLVEKKFKVKLKQIRTVSKEENLVPLLFFKNVDLIFLDSRSTSLINKQFNIKLKKLKWNIEWGAEALIRSGIK